MAQSVKLHVPQVEKMKPHPEGVCLDAVLSETKQELYFKLVNNIVVCSRFDRAVLWDCINQKVLAVSGQSSLSVDSSLINIWTMLLKYTQLPHKTAAIKIAQLPEEKELNQITGGVSVAWLPIKVSGEMAAGVWLERWSPHYWDEDSINGISVLERGLSAAWKTVVGRPLKSKRTKVKWTALILTLLIVAALVLVRLPMRIVADCEITPDDPVVVAAPMDGVIDTVVVKPGQVVSTGDVLFTYDSRALMEDWNVSQEQVKLLVESMRMAKLNEFSSQDSKGEASLLAFRVRQEEIREELARKKVEQATVSAKQAGMVVIDQPHEWSGRPVQTGERVLLLIDPKETYLTLKIHESDYIEFSKDQDFAVFLNAAGGQCRAKIRYIASHASVQADGTAAFVAEADWVTSPLSPRMGLSGTAILYGQKVSLAYWLFRRPWSSLRSSFGF